MKQMKDPSITELHDPSRLFMGSDETQHLSCQRSLLNELRCAVSLRDADLVQTVLRLLEEPSLPMQWLALPSPHTAAPAHHSQLLRPPSPPLYACWLPAPAYVHRQCKS